MTEHDPVVLNVEEWADYWASLKVDAVLVSVTGILAFYQTKVPFHRKGKFLGDRRFLRRVLRRGQEARPARDRAHESGPQLGRRGGGPSGVVPARRARQCRAPHRGPPAVPHLHVHHVHDRLHAGHHAGDQLALRRGRPVHQRLAAAGRAAGLPLRAVPEPAAAGDASPIGTSSTSAPSTCGSSTIPSPRRRSRRTSISPTSAAASARRPTW